MKMGVVSKRTPTYTHVHPNRRGKRAHHATAPSRPLFPALIASGDTGRELLLSHQVGRLKAMECQRDKRSARFPFTPGSHRGGFSTGPGAVR